MFSYHRAYPKCSGKVITFSLNSYHLSALLSFLLSNKIHLDMFYSMLMITRNTEGEDKVGCRQNYGGGSICLYNPSVSPVAISSLSALLHNAYMSLFSALDSVPVF